MTVTINKILVPHDDYLRCSFTYLLARIQQLGPSQCWHSLGLYTSRLIDLRPQILSSIVAGVLRDFVPQGAATVSRGIPRGSAVRCRDVGLLRPLDLSVDQQPSSAFQRPLWALFPNVMGASLISLDRGHKRRKWSRRAMAVSCGHTLLLFNCAL